MKYKTIVIDDSSIQRLTTGCLVKNHPKLELVGEYANPYEGMKVAFDDKIDILFLDVLMGDVNAFDVLDHVEVNCAIIMNSTWERFAKKAFDYGIDDFLTKPISKSRFENAVNKVIKKIKLKKAYQVETPVYFWNTELSEIF